MPSVNQAIKIRGKDIYKFGGDPISILGAPEDTDWQRWSMLNDRKSSRMYFFKGKSDNKIYQFLYDGRAYQYDDSFPVLTLKGITKENNTRSIAMLSTPNFEKVKGVNGKVLPVPNNYHVYMQQSDNPELIHQFIWEKATYNLEANGITRDVFGITGFPKDTDWKRWSMSYDSNHYQLALEAYILYAFKEGSDTEIYYGRYGHKEQGSDVYGYEGILTLEEAPSNTDHSSMSMMFDGVNKYLYMLTKDNV
ncbi:MAG: hypothetical protein KAG14_02620 [Mycoplasmataceae bacterium]|nr:hypothetical protein [Mycoplasmataceae bacterium]